MFVARGSTPEFRSSPSGKRIVLAGAPARTEPAWRRTEAMGPADGGKPVPPVRPASGSPPASGIGENPFDRMRVWRRLEEWMPAGVQSSAAAFTAPGGQHQFGQLPTWRHPDRLDTRRASWPRCGDGRSLTAVPSPCRSLSTSARTVPRTGRHGPVAVPLSPGSSAAPDARSCPPSSPPTSVGTTPSVVSPGRLHATARRAMPRCPGLSPRAVPHEDHRIRPNGPSCTATHAVRASAALNRQCATSPTTGRLMGRNGGSVAC